MGKQCWSQAVLVSGSWGHSVLQTPALVVWTLLFTSLSSRLLYCTDYTVYCLHHQDCYIVQIIMFTVYIIKVAVLYRLYCLHHQGCCIMQIILFIVYIIKVAVLYRFPCSLFTSPRSPILYGLYSSLWPSSRSLYCTNFIVHRLHPRVSILYRLFCSLWPSSRSLYHTNFTVHCLRPQGPYFVWTLLFTVTIIIKVPVLYKLYCSPFTSPKYSFSMDFTVYFNIIKVAVLYGLYCSLFISSRLLFCTDYAVHCLNCQGCCIVQIILFNVYIIKVAVLYRFHCSLFTSPRSPILYGLYSSLWPSSRSLYCTNFTVHHLRPHFCMEFTVYCNITIYVPKVPILYGIYCLL